MTNRTTAAVASAVNRKRSRPLHRQGRSYAATSLPVLAIALVLAFSAQSFALSASSSAVHQAADLRDASIQLEEVKLLEHTNEEEYGADLLEHEDEFEDEDEDEDEFDEEDDEDEEEDEDDEYDEDDEDDQEDLLDEEEYDHEEDDFDEDEEEEEENHLEYENEADYDEEEHDRLEDLFDEEQDEDHFENDEEAEFDEEDYHHVEDLDEEEYEDAEEDDHDDEDDWTPEEFEEMDVLYSRYLQEIARRYGPNWRDEYELVVDKEEIYERYLEFEERKLEREAEERRLLTQASHKALLQHEEANRRDQMGGQNRTDQQISTGSSGDGNTMVTELPPRRGIVLFNTGMSYYNYNNVKKNKSNNNRRHECPASKNTITSRRENSQCMVGSI
eukprot:CAMPEP_0197182546 /NCGR_PEP_ID=MMETSP1423-20130617/6472_1 /TAXON_ID=476441 /ORGANISM="Pseudo-nitzschia heimii, Strain UNC1101" /LENGTH=387 /DNA_ID=CAMNT_0042632985 /DNA_START=62 /DNA_END=1225 /DNA_ORIENTATION=+